VPGVEDDRGDGVRKRPVPRGSAERAKATRRSFWTARGDEGEAMAAVVLVGVLRCARAREEKGAEEGERVQGE
jgi:hypothetical protein